MARMVGIHEGLTFASTSGKCVVTACIPSYVQHKNGAVDWQMRFQCEGGSCASRAGFMITSRNPNVMLSVADGGEIICGGEDSVLSDFIWVFDAKGDRVVYKKLKQTKLCSVCMADDGSFCCYETELSDYQEQDQKAFIIDAQSGDAVGKIDVTGLFGHGVMPDIKSIAPGCVTFDLDGFDVGVSFDSKIINAREWLLHRCEAASRNEYGYSLLYMSDELEPHEALIALKYASEKKFTGKDKALVYRRMGELLEDSFHDSTAAAEVYRAALSINSAVGVKKRLAAIERRLKGGMQNAGNDV